MGSPCPCVVDRRGQQAGGRAVGSPHHRAVVRCTVCDLPVCEVELPSHWVHGEAPDSGADAEHQDG